MTAQTHDTTTTASTAARPARRADAGTVRLSQRDIHGLLLADVYYQCPHRPDNPRHTADHPAHPRTVKAPERRLDQITGLFFAEHVFGPHRAALLAAQLPTTDQAAAADRDAQAAALTARLKQLDTAQNAQILSLEQLSPDPADTAAAAMRARITDRFAELHHQREQAQAQLNSLQAATPKAADPTLLDELPLAGNILPGLDPALKARLLAAFDLQILWNKPAGQATVYAEITEATLLALPGILSSPCPAFSILPWPVTMTRPTLPQARRPMCRICSSPRYCTKDFPKAHILPVNTHPADTGATGNGRWSIRDGKGCRAPEAGQVLQLLFFVL